MAWPPEMRVWKVPGTRSIRAAPPRLPTTFWTLASLAPVTDSSTETSTWFVAGSTAHAVPAIRADRYRVSVTRARSAPLRATAFGTAPAALTLRAAALSVTVTTSLPVLLSRYAPAVCAGPRRWVSVVASAAGSGVAGAATASALGAAKRVLAVRPTAMPTAAARRTDRVLT